MPRLVLVIALLATMRPHPAAAQQPLAVPKFPVVPSPIGLTGDVRPHEYLGVIGRRAAWLGEETGTAELWIHPFKLADRFALSFKIPDYVEPIPGADVARTVEVRPEMTTITYSHATFTVKEHILAPLDEPGLLILLDVRTIHPLEIIASFRMVFQYAWPGAFGGQYTYWDDDNHAFVLSESLARNNAMIGSPWATTASSHPAHALPDAPNTFFIPIDSARATREFVPIAIVGGTLPRDTVQALYRRLITGAQRLYEQRRAYDSTLIAQTATLETPDSTLNLALKWSEVDLDDAWTCNPDLGCGLVAGWGPSGRGERPGFGWFFGGDAAINSYAMDATGMWDEVATGLKFFAKYQRADGKIPHEISQAAGRIPWFTDFPYPYYHADTTPYWIDAVWRYWRASGDSTLVGELWPAIQKAYAWCRRTDTDGDGLIENTAGGLGAIEVGALGEDIYEDVYVAAVTIEAHHAMADLARVMGDDSLAAAARAEQRTGLATLNDRFWRAADGYYAFGILTSGKTNNSLTMWPATAAAFGLLPRDRAERMMQRLASDVISTDWGARPLSDQSPLYDPMHYNNGAVWPFVTGFVTWGQYNARRPWSGYPLIDALSQMTFDWARGHHPELLSGAFYRPLDTAVPQQFFATSMLLSPALYGLLGWQPDAPAASAVLAPQLPPTWTHVTARELRVGASRVTAELDQRPGHARATLSAAGPAVTLEFVQAVPPGAHDVRATLDGRSVKGALETGLHDEQARVTVHLSRQPQQVEVSWSGGLEVVPPHERLVPGQTSHGLRVLDFRATGSGWTLEVEGSAGRSYDVDLVGASVVRSEGATIVRHDGERSVVRVTFASGAGRATRTITLSSQ